MKRDVIRPLTEWAEHQPKEPVRWVIPDYIPRRVVSSIYAPRNAGKTLAAIWLAAEASKGTFGDKLTVWMNSQEDDLRSVLRPRFDAAGFTDEQVRLTGYRWQFPRDLGELEKALRLHKAGGKPDDLLILDSIQSHITRPYHQVPAKESIMGLLALAIDLDLGVVLIGHTTRGTHRTVEAMIAGSSVLQAESKAIYIFGPEPVKQAGDGEDEENKEANPRHVLACERMGVAGKPMSILFDRLTRDDEQTGRPEPYLSRVGVCPWTAAQVLKAAKTDDAGGREAGMAARVVAWIEATLEKYGKAMLTSDLEEKAQADGAYGSKATFERARAQLKKDGRLISRKPNGETRWWVALPGQPFPDEDGWSTPSTPSNAPDGDEGDAASADEVTEGDEAEQPVEPPPDTADADPDLDPAEPVQAAVAPPETTADPHHPEQHITPDGLRRRLTNAMDDAGFGFDHVACFKPRYVTNGHGPCLVAGVYEDPKVRMPLDKLQDWERALRAVPGVVDTKIIHEDKPKNPENVNSRSLRDQVLVTHLRDWEE